MSALPLAPILTPLGVALLCLIPLRRSLKAGLALVGALATLLCSGLLLNATADGSVLVSELGGWPAPFGIVMTADRLSAGMSVLASLSGVVAVWFMIAHEDRVREQHHAFALSLLLFTGVQLSFLTGDLFNLFVAFEVMLVASYALAVLGSTREQLREGFRYILMNLAASTLLVLACGLVYGTLGTLNYAHIAERTLELGPRATVSVLAVLLTLVFASKAALFPLGFWLPGTYPALPQASSAFFAAILTKVGVYALIRLFTTVLPVDSALPQAFLLALGAATMLFGALGALSQREWRRILSFTVMGSVGYLAFGIGLGTPDGLRAALAYLAVSVVVTLATFLIAAVAERAAGTPAVRGRRGFIEPLPWLAGAFLLCLLTVAGLPPTAGFVAKYALVRAGLAQGSVLAVAGVVCALLGSLITLMALLTVWRDFFWGKADRAVPMRPVTRRTTWPAYFASALVAALVVLAGPLFTHAEATARQLRDPWQYVRSVLGGEPVQIPARPTGRELMKTDKEEPK